MMVNNTNNHLSPQILKNTTYDVGNPCLEQTCSGVLKVNIDPNPPILINGGPKSIHIKVNNKKIHTELFQSKRPHTTTTMNDNTNMDSAMAG